MTDATAYSSGSSLRIRISPQTRDFVIFSLWVGVTYVQFPYDEFLLYPLAGYYAWAVWRDRDRIASLVPRSWVLILFPVWSALSFLWAVDAEAALKQSAYLALTIMICFQVAATLEPRRIMHAVLLSTGVIGVINLATILGTGVEIGIFQQKNTMGASMVIMWTVSVATVLDRKSPLLLRYTAIVLALIAFYVGAQSGSATAVMLILATGTITLLATVILSGGLFRPSRLVTACFMIALLSTVALLILPRLHGDPVTAVLDHFGKDATLTGRTVLWNYAEEQISERPLLGVGSGGFWRYHASPLVQKIFEEFHKGPNDSFNFHNSYYEIAVHQGLIGLVFAAMAVLWAVSWVIRGAVTLGTLPQIYFLCHALAVVVRTFTEADLLRPFVLFHMLLWIGALSAIRAARRRPSPTLGQNERIVAKSPLKTGS